MNLQDIGAAMEKMSEDELQAILDTEFDADLEKEASDNVAQSELENALYAYGMYKADLEIEAEEAGDAGLSKEASAEFETAEQEISAAIEAGVSELGLDEIEDDVDMHKTAMAAATLIFEGYTDQLEKWAAKSKKDGKGIKGMYNSLKGKAGKLADKAGKHLGKAGKSLAKHKGAIGGGAALAAAGYAGGRVHEHMKKNASELTAAELIDLTLSKQASLDVIVDGIEKLAARGKGKAGLLAKGMGHIKKHQGKLKAGGLAAGAGAAGYMAGRAHKKD
jgi:hypothetical protein